MAELKDVEIYLKKSLKEGTTILLEDIRNGCSSREISVIYGFDIGIVIFLLATMKFFCTNDIEAKNRINSIFTKRFPILNKITILNIKIKV